MINTILTEANQVVNSLEHYNTLKSIGNTFLLDDESFGALSSVTNSVIMGIFSETEFVTHLIDSSGLDTKKAESIFGQVKNKILNPFKLKVKDIVSNNQVKTTGVLDDSNINTLRQAAPLPQPPQLQHTQPIPDPTPTKASLLSEIESPQRTVIKKYVIEHEPITDPEHIIDDTIDTRPRLEQ
jgi:hypothetical protein